MIESVLLSFKSFLFSFWWIIIPPVLVFIFLDLWLFYRREQFKKGISWTLLEIKIPREIEKTPKAMEQIFAAMHAMYTFNIPLWSKWWKGVVQLWSSFEIVGRAQSTHFLVRVPENFRDLLESSIYAQYPDAEVSFIPEENDYVNHFSANLPNDEYDLFGSDFVLARPDAYPIQTYEYFEHITEEKRIDSIATITELMSKLESSEAIWIQVLIRPTGDSWVKKGESMVQDLMGEKKGDPTPLPLKWLINGLEQFAHFLKDLIIALFEPPTSIVVEKKEERQEKKTLSPGQRKVVEAVENKISKIGFEGALRFIYVDKKDEFTSSNIAGVMGAFRQYNAINMNSLRPNINTMPIARGVFKKRKIRFKKRRLYSHYRIREFPQQFSIFNTEELATLYHFPITGVKSPLISRATFRKGGPPSDLPVVE